MPGGQGKRGKDKVKRKSPKGTHNNPAYASHGNIKNMVEKNEKAEEISRIVGETFQYFNRTPCKTNEEIAERLNSYFSECCEKGQIPTVEDMCLALGITRSLLYHWQHEGPNLERRMMIAKAKEVLAAIDAKLVSEGKIPQVTYIFRAKNYFGLKDQTSVSWEQNTSENIEDQIDEERLREKYLNRGYEQQIVIEAPEVRQLPEVIEVKPKEAE